MKLRKSLAFQEGNVSEEHRTCTSSNKPKKKTIDWPQECAPGVYCQDFERLDITEFTAGFLAMIKPYDSPQKEVLLSLLEILMIKASSYTWKSVRGFYAHTARQVELRHLEFSNQSHIREIACTFFKHSDLKSHNPARDSKLQAATSNNTNIDKSKPCRQWNYTGECNCDSSASSYANHHCCRVCSKDHPMLKRSKRKSAIPEVNFNTP